MSRGKIPDPLDLPKMPRGMAAVNRVMGGLAFVPMCPHLADVKKT
jgi:hypothetical protein